MCREVYYRVLTGPQGKLAQCADDARQFGKVAKALRKSMRNLIRIWMSGWLAKRGWNEGCQRFSSFQKR